MRHDVPKTPTYTISKIQISLNQNFKEKFSLIAEEPNDDNEIPIWQAPETFFANSLGFKRESAVGDNRSNEGKYFKRKTFH